jgi:hypothetical protein
MRRWQRLPTYVGSFGCACWCPSETRSWVSTWPMTRGCCRCRLLLAGLARRRVSGGEVGGVTGMGARRGSHTSRMSMDPRRRRAAVRVATAWSGDCNALDQHAISSCQPMQVMQGDSPGVTPSSAAVCAVNGGHECLRDASWSTFPRSSLSGYGPAGTGEVQEALDALEAQAVGSDERGGGGAFAVDGDQFDDVALIDGGRAGSLDAARSVSRLTPGW